MCRPILGRCGLLASTDRGCWGGVSPRVLRIGAEAMDGNDPTNESTRPVARGSGINKLELGTIWVRQNFERPRARAVLASTELDDEGMERGSKQHDSHGNRRTPFARPANAKSPRSGHGEPRERSSGRDGKMILPLPKQCNCLGKVV